MKQLLTRIMDELRPVEGPSFSLYDRARTMERFLRNEIAEACTRQESKTVLMNSRTDYYGGLFSLAPKVGSLLDYARRELRFRGRDKSDLVPEAKQLVAGYVVRDKGNAAVYWEADVNYLPAEKWDEVGGRILKVLEEVRGEGA